MATGVMQMVPLLMREDNKESDDDIVFNRNDDYDPKVVSLGPYHHGKKKLEFVEDYKPKAVEMFIEGGPTTEDAYLCEIRENIGYVRSCYLEKFMPRKYSDDQLFAQMMLRDACVILNYIYVMDDPKRDAMIRGLGTAVYNSIIRDMYLLENQVPFRILEILVYLRYSKGRDAFVKDMEEHFFRMFFHDQEAKLPVADDINMLGKEPLHLLEIFRRVIVTGHDRDTSVPDEHCCDIDNLISGLEYSGCRSKYDTSSYHGYVFRSVTDLKSKGIYCTASGNNSLKGVRFYPYESWLSAKLMIPPCRVTADTRVFFMNMIAYEFSPNSKFLYDKFVTAYVNFMKQLVVSKQDVKELRDQRVIFNGLGSDEQVAKVFKALNTYDIVDISFYAKVMMDIEKQYYNSKARTWMADLKTTYFNSPWSIVALAGSIFLLCLTIVQTYYAAKPSDHGHGGGSKRGL